MLLSDVEGLSSKLSARSRHFSTTSLSLDEQMEILQEQLEMVQTQCSGTLKKTKMKSLKRELLSLKRQQQKELRKARNSGGCFGLGGREGVGFGI